MSPESDNPAGSETRWVSDLTRVDENTVLARTDLVLGNWSPDYLHGPDVMEAACAAVEELLEEGEVVSGIQSLRFLKVMTNNLMVVASAAENGVPPNYEEQEPSVVGSFVTSNGRTLNLGCYQTGERVTKRNEVDDEFRVLDRLLTYAGGALGEIPSYDFAFRPPADLLKNGLGSQVSLFLNIVLVLSAKHTGSGLMGGCENAVLPDWKKFSGWMIESSSDSRKRKFTPKGFVLNPVDFRLRSLSDYRSWMAGGTTMFITGNEEAILSLFREAGISIREAQHFM